MTANQVPQLGAKRPRAQTVQRKINGVVEVVRYRRDVLCGVNFPVDLTEEEGEPTNTVRDIQDDEGSRHDDKHRGYVVLSTRAGGLLRFAQVKGHVLRHEVFLALVDLVQDEHVEAEDDHYWNDDGAEHQEYHVEDHVDFPPLRKYVTLGAI